MQNPFKGKSIFFTSGVLIAIFAIVIGLIIAIGQVYRSGLGKFEQPKIQDYALTEVPEIKRLTLRKQGETGCIEVTPEGIIRVYEICGEKLTQTSRPTDPNNILKLFKMISIKDLKKIQARGGQIYELIIETATGTETVYITDDDGSGGEIIKQIQDIIEDVPNTSPSPLIVPTPTIPGTSAYPAATPTASIGSPSSPLPSPSSQVLVPFNCDFSESTDGKKPFNISNIICSSNPSTPP